MRKVLIIGVTVVMLLVGCGEEIEKGDSTGPTNKQKVENAAPVIEDKYIAEDVAKAAAAANEEVTLEVLDKMSDQQENDTAAMKQWIDDVAYEEASSSTGDVVSVQEAMIKEGYSCTFQEMNQVAASGTLGEQ
jgi:primase-polymerase (primpol)-like protein